MLFENRFEIFGWLLAVVGIIAMGVIVFTGPYHRVNKPAAAAAAAPPVQTVRIVTSAATIGAYDPKTVTVHVGQAVAFKNVSNQPHTVTADNHSFDSGTIDTNSQTWVFRPTKAGTFPYTCVFHPSMHGTLIVQG